MAYGRSKKLMEDALNAANASGAVETVITRPCWFYGPEQPPRQSTFFQMIREGKAPIVGDGEARRSMSYVDNTSLGLLLAAGERARPRGRRTGWRTSGPYSMNEIIDTVEDLLENEFGMRGRARPDAAALGGERGRARGGCRRSSAPGSTSRRSTC